MAVSGDLAAGERVVTQATSSSRGTRSTDMLRRIIGFSIDHPGIVLTASLAIALAGSYAFYNLPIDVFPDLDVDPRRARDVGPGLDSYDVEKQITLPLERALLDGAAPREDALALHVRALGREALVQGRHGLGRRSPRRVVALQGVPLPPGVTWQLAPPSDSLGTIYRYVIDAPRARPDPEAAAPGLGDLAADPARPRRRRHVDVRRRRQGVPGQRRAGEAPPVRRHARPGPRRGLGEQRQHRRQLHQPRRHGAHHPQRGLAPSDRGH